MSAQNSYKNRSPNSGVSQHQRILNALLPDFVRVDERTDADLILFAKEYAAYLKYYNAQNQADGDWIPLMGMDVSVILATIHKKDAKSYINYVKQLLSAIKNDNKTENLQRCYTAIFNFLTTLVYELDSWMQALPADLAFTEYLRNSISSRFALPFYRLLQFYRASEKGGMINTKKSLTSPLPPIETELAKNLLTTGLSEIWEVQEEFTAPVNGATTVDKIKNSADHAVFKGILWNILKSYSAVIENAGTSLQETLDNFPTHEPHYALFLTFIKLFEKAQSQLNDFTNRHLQFYYKNILGFRELPAKPDKVHLLLELQKNRDQHLLKKGTVFKGGKDKAGQELFYTLKNDVVINQGKIKSIRSVCTQKEKIGTKEYLSPFAALVANSQDGMGGELISPDKSWKPFGKPETNSRATTGFAVAHPVLFLKEGEREISVVFNINIDEFDPEPDLERAFKVLITGEKGWHEAEIKKIEVEQSALNFIIKLNAADPGFLPYDEKIHQNFKFNTRLPVMQFLINNTPGEFNFQKIFQSCFVTSVKVTVDVKGVRDLYVQNDLGPLDPSKLFPIFTHQPRLGSSLIIGSNEVFLKNLNSATAHIEWDGTDWVKYNSDDSFNKIVRVEVLENGLWVSDPVSEKNQQTIFKTGSDKINNQSKEVRSKKSGIEKASASLSSVAADNREKKTLTSDRFSVVSGAANIFPQVKEQIKLPVLPGNSTFNFSANPVFSIREKRGFARISLNSEKDFGHSGYSLRLTEAIQKELDLPPEPYTPLVKSLYVNYSAAATINITASTSGDFDCDSGCFYHVSPFGTAARNRSVSDSSANTSLLPVYNNEGEIYIGIDDFSPGRSIQLLFKVSDGSADPAFSMQKISWSFLTENNQWTDFGQNDLIDDTNNLTKTGIIRFSFSPDAVRENTLMGEQLYWIRGVLRKNREAVCDLIAINAQAVSAELTDFMKNGVEFTEPLAAGTISRLQTNDSAIRKISQPYTSFGGRMKETETQSSARISERLRHKNRAITAWDYERMVLEQFPEIYKVKCINHAQIKEEQLSDDNELAPGHVLVVPIPNLSGKNAVNPLRPRTDTGTLTNIENYLRRYISPFVQLQVKNARFEEIQLDFKVKFHSEDGDFLSNQLMDEIEKYLSPWVFNRQDEVEFGGKISKSVLLDFVEKRDYVDWVACFKMYHIVDGIKSGDAEEAVATSARTVFVSFAGDEQRSDPKHIIDYQNFDDEC